MPWLLEHLRRYPKGRHEVSTLVNPLGRREASTATAYRLARIFYCLWSQGGEYQDPGIDVYK